MILIKKKISKICITMRFIESVNLLLQSLSSHWSILYVTYNNMKLNRQLLRFTKVISNGKDKGLL
jgi:hypothetical protein